MNVITTLAAKGLPGLIGLIILLALALIFAMWLMRIAQKYLPGAFGETASA